MLTIKQYPNKVFSDHGELFETLRANKRFIKAAKTSEIKKADGIHLLPSVWDPVKSFEQNKAESLDLESITEIKADLAINTTNWLDSHEDVHIPKLWTKSIQENKTPYHLQEHTMSFNMVISDDVKASARYYQWADLGLPYQGKTQVLLYRSTIKKERNPFMFGEYAKGHVKNHSVGMRYVWDKLFLCMNSDSEYDREEKDNWDKYISEVVNREDAEAKGFFWAVLEAKQIEGSAVLLGSNINTPTISMEGKGAEHSLLYMEPEQSTPQKADNPQKSFFNSLI